MEVDLWLYPSRPHLLHPAPPGDDGLPTAAVSSPEDDAVRRSPTRQHHFISMWASAEQPPRTGQSQSASHSRGDAVAVAVAAAARPWSFSPSPANSSTSAARFQIPPLSPSSPRSQTAAEPTCLLMYGTAGGRGRERGGLARAREHLSDCTLCTALCCGGGAGGGGEAGREVMNAPCLLLGPGHLFAVFKEISAQWSSGIKGQNNDHCSFR